MKSLIIQGSTVNNLDEKTMNQLSKNKKIYNVLQHTTGNSISTYDNQEMKELIRYLLKMSKFLGITEPPEIEILQMIGQYIKDYWGFYTLAEVNNSIYLAIESNEINHFNKLTPQFLNKIFTEYKKIRQKAIFQYRKTFEELND